MHAQVSPCLETQHIDDDQPRVHTSALVLHTNIPSPQASSALHRDPRISTPNQSTRPAVDQTPPRSPPASRLYPINATFSWRSTISAEHQPRGLVTKKACLNKNKQHVRMPACIWYVKAPARGICSERVWAGLD